MVRTLVKTWSESAVMLSAVPTREALVEDLRLLREKGLPEIDDLELPALLAAAKLVGPADESDDGALIEALLRRSASRLGGGRFGDSTRTLLGLDGDTRALTSGVRRTMAAKQLGVGDRTYRRKHEDDALNQTARQIRTLCTEQRQREELDQRAEHPVESGIAAQWVERFQSYYRLWAPIFGLANDLTAYRSTLLEEPRSYDRHFGTHGPDDPGYSQDEQAEGYARFALYHYAHFEWDQRRFQTLYGGLWMFSEPDVETAVSDAVYRIAWHINPFNERDQSYLRTVLDETPEQELHGFLEQLASSELGQRTHQEWQDWCASCECIWPAGADTKTDYFPTARNQTGISSECQVHQTIEACGLYCELIDQDWRKIADWYHLTDDKITKGVSAERMYAEWRSTERGRDYEAPD